MLGGLGCWYGFRPALPCPSTSASAIAGPTCGRVDEMILSTRHHVDHNACWARPEYYRATQRVEHECWRYDSVAFCVFLFFFRERIREFTTTTAQPFDPGAWRPEEAQRAKRCVPFPLSLPFTLYFLLSRAHKKRFYSLFCVGLCPATRAYTYSVLNFLIPGHEPCTLRCWLPWSPHGERWPPKTYAESEIREERAPHSRKGWTDRVGFCGKDVRRASWASPVWRWAVFGVMSGDPSTASSSQTHEKPSRIQSKRKEKYSKVVFHQLAVSFMSYSGNLNQRKQRTRTLYFNIQFVSAALPRLSNPAMIWKRVSEELFWHPFTQTEQNKNPENLSCVLNHHKQDHVTLYPLFRLSQALALLSSVFGCSQFFYFTSDPKWGTLVKVTKIKQTGRKRRNLEQPGRDFLIWRRRSRVDRRVAWQKRFGAFSLKRRHHRWLHSIVMRVWHVLRASNSLGSLLITYVVVTPCKLTTPQEVSINTKKTLYFSVHVQRRLS